MVVSERGAVSLLVFIAAVAVAMKLAFIGLRPAASPSPQAELESARQQSGAALEVESASEVREPAELVITQPQEQVARTEADDEARRRAEAMRLEREEAAARESEEKAEARRQAELAERQKEEMVAHSGRSAELTGRSGQRAEDDQPAGTVIDKDGGIMWTAADNGKSIEWRDAQTYCENLSLGGFSDWRLPSIGELGSLYQRASDASPWSSRAGEPLLGIHFSACCAWSSTLDEKSRNLFYSKVHGNEGRIVIRSVDLPQMRALCVRPLLAITSKGSTGEVEDRRQEIRYVEIPAGSFTMGCSAGDRDCRSNENPPRRVIIARPFFLAATETTNRQYRACIDAGACPAPQSRHSAYDRNKTEHPVVDVSWNDAVAFCQWAGGRLPSEAEWEYGARGGREASRYAWGDASPMCRRGASNGANYDDGEGCEDTETFPVAGFAPNGFDLYDTAGNAWEWVDDCWHDDYAGAPADASSWTMGGNCARRVLRGGSWDSGPKGLRVSFRDRSAADSGDDEGGFRCARSD